MSTTLFEDKLTQEELKEAILSFARSRDTGALGTMGPAGLRVSPVKYFLDDNFHIYIPSQGGSKFDNLEVNGEVCLLVASPFQEDYHQIKGVQFFGTAEVLASASEEYAVAEKLCPWPLSSQARLIQIFCDSAVYVDRLGSAHLKQNWRYY
ncbi:MAG: pyridoxamine 5'-phosphate oxidase family protein [Firmicutes bacterium]|nr:pyridoxamine 5'-phosphate oxidase family protein [Bacillota bacterium]